MNEEIEKYIKERFDACASELKKKYDPIAYRAEAMRLAINVSHMYENTDQIIEAANKFYNFVMEGMKENEKRSTDR